MSWHKIFGVLVLIALFGLLLRPGVTVGAAEAVGLQAPVLATAPAMGKPVVVKSGGAPLLDRIVVARGGPDVEEGVPGRSGGVLPAPWPDVVLLLLPAGVRALDPFGLAGSVDGPARLRAEVRPELLLAARWDARGGPATAILPPGVGPAPAPLPGRQPPPARSLELAPLPPGAPELILVVARDDLLLRDAAEALALVLRGRGFATRVSGPGEADGPAATLLRWRPPTADPALALLDLAGSRPELLDGEPSALPIPALLGPDVDARTLAALEIQERWVAEARVVPLMTTARWIVVHPDLHGVRVRGDGVPLLHDAFWDRSP